MKFRELKEELQSSKGVLAYASSKKIEIFTNTAMTGGMGYALCKPNDEGDLRIVACGYTG